MKRVKFISILVTVLAVCLIVGVGLYFLNTPEYTLIKIKNSVKESGIEGLDPYLTENAKKTINDVLKISENKLVQITIGMFNKDDNISVLKSKAKEIQWKLKDILKSKNTAIVVLSFNYKEHISGTFEIGMVREKGSWKVDNIEFPKFDEINLK